MTDINALHALVSERLGATVQKVEIAYGEITLTVLPRFLLDVCLQLRDTPEFAFEMLMDVCGVDYLYFGLSEWETEGATATGFERGVDRSEYLHPKAPPFVTEGEKIETRFAAVYHLLSLKHNWRIRIRSYLDSHHPTAPSVMAIWPSANWFEREAFDLFGILFTDHPDLRRILTDYGFVGHPFRKDFPLSGHVEPRYDAALQRVIYEPVSIVPRILEPKVIRREVRYQEGES